MLILEQMKKCFDSMDYQAHHEIDKVVEYSSPRLKRLVYLRKDYAKRGSMRIVMDPSIEIGHLFSLGDVVRPRNEFQYGTNLRRFPKRLHKGKEEIHYGKAVDLRTLDGLKRALEAYDF